MQSKTRHILVSLMLVMAVACSRQEDSAKQENELPTASVQAADQVFTGGKVYTVNEKQPWAEAVAVKGNKIVYVGDDAGAKKFVGKDTKQIDLAGRMMMPGFVEGHFHTTTQGIILHGPDLQTDSMDELLAKLKKYADEHPDLKFINGWGVRPNLYGPGEPTAAMIDKIIPDRPVYLWQVDGHSAWINTKAMEMAGLTKDTPDTVPGASYFERDKDGNPTGYIVEVPAQVQILKKFVTIDDAYIREGMRKWFGEYAKAGITAVHDFGWAGVDQDMAIGILKDFEKDGTLKMRIYGSYYWNDATIDPVPIAKKMRDENQTGLVQVTALKINMDGDDDKYSSLLVGGYADKPDAKPEPILPFDKINDAVVRADAEHLQIICHCFGDLAVRNYSMRLSWRRKPIRNGIVVR